MQLADAGTGHDLTSCWLDRPWGVAKLRGPVVLTR